MSALRWLDSHIPDSKGAATVAIPATVRPHVAASVATIATVAIRGESENSELRYLVATIAEREGWPAVEIEEASAVALADHEAALTCWRARAREYGVSYPPGDDWPGDDRVTCRRCANLTAGGRCLAAARGELAGVAKTYSPALVARRCECFGPLPGDPDRRGGRERWPGLEAAA